LETALNDQILNIKKENLTNMSEDEVRTHDESLARLEELRSTYATKMGQIGEATKGLGTFFKGFWLALGQQIIQMLIKVGLEHIVLWGLEKALGIQRASMRMGQLTAETFAAAFASTAAIPIVGPALAPGVALASTAAMLAGATAAAAAGAAFGAGTASLAGAAAEGLEEVPKTGTYLVHKGERIVQPEQNVALGEFLKENRAGGKEKETIIEAVNVAIAFPNITDVEAFLNMDRDALNNAVAKAVNEGVRRGIIKGVQVSV
jgi:hypothetical protein